MVVGPYKVLDNLKHDQKLKDEREVEEEKRQKEKSKNEKTAKATSMSQQANKTGHKVVIRLRELKRFYRVGVEEIHALDGVDLEVRENEYVAIMGHSGSGKSTLMNVLGCLDRPSDGCMSLTGTTLPSLAIRSWPGFATSGLALCFSRSSFCLK